MVCGWLMRVCVVRLLGFSRLPWCCTVNAPIYIYTVAQCWWLVKAVCICVIGVIIVFLGWLWNIHRILPASSLIYIISYTFEKCTESNLSPLVCCSSSAISSAFIYLLNVITLEKWEWVWVLCFIYSVALLIQWIMWYAKQQTNERLRFTGKRTSERNI